MLTSFRDGVINMLAFFGCAYGIVTIAFAWLIASGNAAPTAYGSMVNAAAISAVCYLISLTIAFMKHAA